ncbi:alkaline phosphatase (plasmid) [Fulvitalea axinellae]|uniref:Alkaline phosphatase n=1 Tax=Fulvitalea axinellae TaxID=1182444 RepID=A0AAU9DCM6_9BACT|nr:alkaline phosphatase [Fulvitalea axinellae]
MCKVWKSSLLLGAISFLSANVAFAQEEYRDPKKRSYIETFEGGMFHKVERYENVKFKKRPKNVIIMIGDGMGIAQVFAGMTANKGELYLENFRYCGFSKTQSADDYVTDSAAGGTAIATGKKTKNHAIGLDKNGRPAKNILEDARDRGMMTGVVTTSLINHATPAAFMAHQAHRKMYEEIAWDIVDSGVDVAVGGGRKHFEGRTDGINLSDTLRNRGVKVAYSVDELEKHGAGPVVGLFADMHVPHYPERGMMLSRSVEYAINKLEKDKDGYVLVVEGSKIDAGGHQNKTPFAVKEMLDFDQAIGVALRHAAQDRETLIVVTADHETGGMANTGGDMETGMVKAKFVYGKHTGIPVPVFAFGPGAEKFTGFMENTDIHKKIKEALKML